jgi:hypothetical protein
VPSQQPQGQLQTQHSVDTSNYIMEQYNIKSKTCYRQALEEKHMNAEKLTNERSNNNTTYNNNSNNNNIVVRLSVLRADRQPFTPRKIPGPNFC